MQDTFDRLYEQSKQNKKFSSIMRIIRSRKNILLSYRNIKTNKGSKTVGVNRTNIVNLAETKPDKFVEYIQNRFKNYIPHEVRRVDIPKPNGKTRPLGIPTIEDRIVQQCIKQVLEPICEAKFHEHSYGFRPNRSTHHAIARSYRLINLNKLHYVVNVDIKGFFDNVNHGKLLKQLWTVGIQDKTLLKVISKMLKAPVKEIGVQEKGTPQGGILSPLLSNVVLNELDWWISSQCQTFKTRRDYYKAINPNNGRIKSDGKYGAMKATNLKEMFIVRYADDFRIFCRNYEKAQIIFKAVKLWLNERLRLEISCEKSKVINLRKNSMEFLGFTFCYMDFNKIGYQVRKYIYNQLKGIAKIRGEPSKTFQKLYGHNNERRYFVNGIALYPVRGIRMKPPMNFSQTICDYTESGRKEIHKNLRIDTLIIRYLLENPIKGETMQYNDNRISLYVGQNGRCSVTGDILEVGKMNCHHKTPRNLGGKDNYNNLTFVKTEIHKLLHAIKPETIKKLLDDLKLNMEELKKLNRLRKRVGNESILIY